LTWYTRWFASFFVGISDRTLCNGRLRHVHGRQLKAGRRIYGALVGPRANKSRESECYALVQIISDLAACPSMHIGQGQIRALDFPHMNRLDPNVRLHVPRELYLQWPVLANQTLFVQ